MDNNNKVSGREGSVGPHDFQKGLSLRFNALGNLFDDASDRVLGFVRKQKSSGLVLHGQPRKFLTMPFVSGKNKKGKSSKGHVFSESDGLVYCSTSSSQKNLARTIIEGLIAGAVAGVTVETALYPIDTIKTRLQVARAGGGVNFKGLYSGISGNIAGVLPASAIFIGVYEPVKQALLKVVPEHLSAGAHLLSGACGGLAASIVRVPTEVVKQRMQLREFASFPAALSGITAKEGIKGLFAGYGAFLLRDLPFDAIQFAIYEQLKIAGKAALKRDLHDPEMAAIGAVSGALTGAVTTPLDVIKTRLMVQGTSGQYKGVIDCVSQICREEGASALFKGIGPRVMWIGIGGSIFFGVLEKTKFLLAQASAKAPPKIVQV